MTVALLGAAPVLGQGARPRTPADPAQQLFDQAYQYHTGDKAPRDPARALQAYQRVLERNPDLFPALHNAAVAAYELGEYKQAQTYFIRATRAGRQDPQQGLRYEAMARNGLGSCYQKAGQLREAEEQFRFAARMYPGLVEAHYNLVNLLVKEKRWKEADAALEVARRVAPSAQYEIFAGRQAGRRGSQDLFSLGGVGGLVLLLTGLMGYSLLLRLRRRS
ncbi:MAG: tetratricopeptide repeat protein [Candidatus Latescibacterota bacterium]